MYTKAGTEFAISGSDDSREQHAVFRNLTRYAFILLLLSGITGTVFLVFAGRSGYGPIAWTYGSKILYPVSGHGNYSSVTPVLLLSTLAFAALGFLTWSTAFKPGRTEVKWRKQVRLMLIFNFLAYLESIIVLALYLIIGDFTSSTTLIFGSSNLLESLEYVGTLGLLVSFFAFLILGVMWGTFMGSFETEDELNRFEFVLVAPFLFIGMFYYPFAIVAGTVALYGTGNENYSLNRVLTHASAFGRRITELIISNRRLQWVIFIASLAVLGISLYFGLQVEPLMVVGQIYGYVPAWLFSRFGIFVVLGTFVGSVLPIPTLNVLFRTKTKLLKRVGILIVIALFGLCVSIFAMNSQLASALYLVLFQCIFGVLISITPLSKIANH